MAWPQKATRKIVIDGVPYLWHFSGHCVLCSEAVITIGRDGDRFFLFVDPFPHGLEFRPAAIASAIRWALDNGWSSRAGPTRGMGFDDILEKNVWLPDGVRHLRERPADGNEGE